MGSQRRHQDGLGSSGAGQPAIITSTTMTIVAGHFSISSSSWWAESNPPVGSPHRPASPGRPGRRRSRRIPRRSCRAAESQLQVRAGRRLTARMIDRGPRDGDGDATDAPGQRSLRPRAASGLAFRTIRSGPRGPPGGGGPELGQERKGNAGCPTLRRRASTSLIDRHRSGTAC